MRILAVAGSSGGHIYPARAFLDECVSADPGTKTLLVLPLPADGKGIPVRGHEIRYIGVHAVSRRLTAKNLLRILDLLKGFWASFRIIASFKPDIVVGFGSIPSIPVVACAWFCRITTVIHEQNVIPGRATRILSYIADMIAVSFGKTVSLLPSGVSKAVLTGNPLRSELVPVDKKKALDFFDPSWGADTSRLTVLVMGGSQGSLSINRGFVSAYNASSWRSRARVIHLCGAGDKAGIEKLYAREGDVKVIPFLPEMEYAYSAADIVISRAGATTVSELIRFGLPAVLVPYPHAYDHQRANAQVLAEAGAAVIVADGDLLSGALRSALEEVLKPGVKDAMAISCRRLRSRDARSFYDEVLKVHKDG